MPLPMIRYTAILLLLFFFSVPSASFSSFSSSSYSSPSSSYSSYSSSSSATLPSSATKTATTYPTTTTATTLFASPFPNPHDTSDDENDHHSRYTTSSATTTTFTTAASETWLENILTIPQSRVLARISNHLCATTLFAALVATAFACEQSDLPLLSPSLQGFVRTCVIPTLPHGIAGSLITLLLAFRTSQAYERFWEGRRLWDGVYAETRGLARLLTLCEPGGANPVDNSATPSWRRQRDVLVAVLAAYPYALKQHLRQETNIQELYDAAGTSIGRSSLSGLATIFDNNTTRTIPTKDPVVHEVHVVLQRALASSNVPLDLLKALSRLVRPLHVNGELLWWQMDSHLAGLTSILGKCERIKGTPVPLSYSRHTSRFFSVYCFTLPLALHSFEDYWLLPLAVAVVSWLLFATEEIGHIIEEPFGMEQFEFGGSDNHENEEDRLQLEVLPLGRYCAEMAADVASLARREMLESEMPGYQDESYVLFDEEPS